MCVSFECTNFGGERQYREVTGFSKGGDGDPINTENHSSKKT